MKKNILLLVITFFALLSYAQQNVKRLNQANWQQHVAYTISVKLNDINNTLQGNISMVYTNNSPNEIKEIYMHLWPNAYSNRNTAFAKQHLENGKTDFYFAKPNEQGSIDSLNFKVDNVEVAWKFTQEIDIALLSLNKVLMPGQSITINTPFNVQLPKVYSRMGHENQLYCITQWFPKPAVYDVNGWNPIPYLDQGEFYSEFGSFDVSITIPKNYVVAATGNLQNDEEVFFLNELANQTKTFDEIPLSSSEFKTLHYLQDSVHDFAWFASKQFNVKKSEVLLSNGKKIATWLFAKNINNKGTEYINEGVLYYSNHIGNYPYNLAQVVITPLKAGGGMEYPTITNCGSIDRTTIIHEVGHNWFYGILGSNEREYPWMDESLNTYYESRCSQEKIDADIAKNGKKKNVMKDLFNLDLEGFGQSRLLYSISARDNEDQAGNLPSTTYTDFNYGAIIYAKNPLSFYMLQNYLGNEKFDEMMHAYYEKWKFKHPLPNDFRSHAETFTGKALSWFFDAVLGTKQILDYKIKSVNKNSITIKNKGELKIPFSLSTLDKNNKTINTIWINEFAGTKKIALNKIQNTKPEQLNYKIDYNESTTDLYKKNNAAKNNYTIRFIPAMENNKKQQIFCIPLYAWNNYNKSMLGLFINNDFFPTQKYEFNFTPLYSFTTNNLNGYLSIAKNINTRNNESFKNVKLGINLTRFATIGLNKNDGIFQNTTYEKISPYIEITFNQATARSLYNNKLILRHVSILENKTNTNYFYNWKNQSISAFDATYKLKHNLATYPTEIKTNLQIGTVDYNYGKLSAEFTQGIAYNASKKKIIIRLFAGTFLGSQTKNNYTDFNQGKSYFQLGGTTGQNDYFYDEAMLGRAEINQSETWMARQIINKDAGFRNFTNIGSSKTWLTSANLTIPFPIKLPIGFYTDCSYGETFVTSAGNAMYQTQFSSVGGLYISLAKNVFEIYLPLFASQNVLDLWKLNGGLENSFERASFLLNLNAMNPIKILKNSIK